MSPLVALDLSAPERSLKRDIAVAAGEAHTAQVEITTNRLQERAVLGVGVRSCHQKALLQPIRS